MKDIVKFLVVLVVLCSLLETTQAQTLHLGPFSITLGLPQISRNSGGITASVDLKSGYNRPAELQQLWHDGFID